MMAKLGSAMMMIVILLAEGLFYLLMAPLHSMIK